MSVATMMGGAMAETQFLPEVSSGVNTYALSEGEREEVLAFLAERAVHTVCLAGFIRDNGVVSPHNRGAFYGCRNSEGRLEGVALVGHATLVEARTRRAFREFALVAQCSTRTHLIMGESDAVEEFWSHYADAGQPMRRACREFLFELRYPLEARAGDGGLRLATPEDLELMLPVHAGLAEAESGVNPLDVDPEGFRARCLRRIEQGRVWVVVGDGGRLLFKADVQADTPEVVYLEGVYVNPASRGTGLGRRSMTRLGFELLLHTRRVCLLANEENERAHAFYRNCGYKLRGVYDTIFLRLD
ncbi:MAG TPA: GNAT family N-acetyltransferase [Pyrinomonadaceae bacterium]|nr:GNAT family N-acetyltransferase [Pyrinomonadaceae bacterium]